MTRLELRNSSSYEFFSGSIIHVQKFSLHATDREQYSSPYHPVNVCIRAGVLRRISRADLHSVFLTAMKVLSIEHSFIPLLTQRSLCTVVLPIVA
jgi:hypothetical protein